MKCLFVKAPFAGWIVDFVKLIEYRTREIYIRERIGIIESGTGTVIGDVNLVGCRFNAKLQMYEWILDDPRRYATPVPFEHKQGAMVWIELDLDWENQASAPDLSPKAWAAASRAYRKKLDEFFAERKKRIAGEV